jgi:hypothetical protein
MTKSSLTILKMMAMTLLFCATSVADLTDFNTWTLVEDPADPSFSGSIVSSSQIVLSANGGPIPAGTDIGYQSVNGLTALSSTQGYYFDPSSDFSVAVDFSMNFTNAAGLLAFGIGIGEDQNGMNSAGVTLVTNGGAPLSYGYASRTNDINQEFGALGGTPQSAARMITSYDAASGDIVVGVSTNADDIAESSFTFAGLQNDWTDSGLIVSFFIRSDQILVFNPWQSGASNTNVTNLRVLSGSRVAAVPEPQSAGLLIGLSVYLVSRRRK